LQRVSVFVDTSTQQYKRRRVGAAKVAADDANDVAVPTAVTSETIAQTAETLRAGLARQQALSAEHGEVLTAERTEAVALASNFRAAMGYHDDSY
jgi:hypothetical protein